MSTVIPDYGTSAEGHLAARIGDIAYVALPCADGFRLASGWRLRRPIGEWTEADVHGSEGIVSDEAGFRAHVEDVALHLNQREALGRKEVRLRVSTPCRKARRSMPKAWSAIPPRRMAGSSSIAPATRPCLPRCASQGAGMRRMGTGRGWPSACPTSLRTGKNGPPIGRSAIGSRMPGRRSMAGR